MKFRMICLVAPALLLGACGDDSIDVSDDGREASGEVLEGSISDAMLPLEELRSQAPLVEPSGDESASAGSASSNASGSAANGDTGSESGDEAGDDPPPSEEPDTEE